MVPLTEAIDRCLLSTPIADIPRSPHCRTIGEVEKEAVSVDRREIALPLLATALAMAAFQIGAGLAKGLFPAVGPQGAATLRLFLGGALLLVVARPWRNWPKQAPLMPLAGLGLAMAGVILLFYLAIERLPLGIAIALQFLGPLAVAVLGSRRAIDLVWAALAGSGVWFLVGPGPAGPALDPVGLLYALGAAVGWASYILLGRTAGNTFGGSTAALSLSIAALLILPVGIAQAGTSLLDAELLPLAFAVALLSAAVPFSLELYALPRLPARTFAVFTSLEPAFAVISGFVILNEVLVWSQTAGVVMVMVAAAGSAWWAADAPAARSS
jgi:inner membrane transporter RhtA